MILANLYLSREQSAKALDVVLYGLVLKPGNRGMLLLKARIEAMRSPLLAIPTLRALHESQPDDMPTTFGLTDLYIAADQTQKAVDLLKEQISVDKDEQTLQKYNMALAIALYKNGQKTESEELFGTLFKSYPTDAVVLQAYSGVLRDDARYNDITAKVIEWFSQNPDSPDGVINIAQSNIDDTIRAVGVL